MVAKSCSNTACAPENECFMQTKHVEVVLCYSLTETGKIDEEWSQFITYCIYNMKYLGYPYLQYL